MAMKGYINVRALPRTKKDFRKLLQEFGDSYSICEKCQGHGEVLNKGASLYPDTISIKYEGVEPLELAYSAGNLNGELIRRVLSRMAGLSNPCDKCHGFGFVPKKSRKIKDGKTS